MNLVHMICALILLFAVVAGMIRIIAGPTAADRMMAAQLFGTCGVAILLLLAKGLENAVLLDIALVVALLAALATTTFVRRAWHSTRLSPPGRAQTKVMPLRHKDLTGE